MDLPCVNVNPNEDGPILFSFPTHVILISIVARAAARRRRWVAKHIQIQISSRRIFTDAPVSSSDAHRDESLFTLVSMIEKIKLRRSTANDHYVQRYLEMAPMTLTKSQALGFIAEHNRHYNTPLSVKQDLEPVVLFILSTGVAPEQVASIAVKAPLLFRSRRVDELFVMFELAGERLGGVEKARRMLLNRPDAFVVDGPDAFREALDGNAGGP